MKNFIYECELSHNTQMLIYYIALLFQSQRNLENDNLKIKVKKQHLRYKKINFFPSFYILIKIYETLIKYMKC